MADNVTDAPVVPPEMVQAAQTAQPVVPETPKAPEEPEAPSEKTLLLQRARMMGAKVSNNMSVETLKARIEEHLEAQKKAQVQEEEVEEEITEPPEMKENKPAAKPLTRQQIREKLLKEQMKLVRLRITNLDPKKKNLPGEIFTVANKYIGTVRKFIPYGESTENGYHVPYCLYEMLKERKFLHIKVTKMANGKGDRVETSWVQEFSLDVLPQLTKAELQKLAAAQIAAGSTNPA